MRSILLKTTAIAGVVGLGVWSLPCPQSADAADHTDPPSIVEANEDIGDIYAWHNAANDTFTAILTFAGPTAPGAELAYSDNVQYGIHISNDDDSTNSEMDLWFQFGENASGDWGIQATGIPGSAGPIVGAVGTDLTDGPAHVWADLTDDPFFFDLAGFGTTLSSGTLSFTAADFFAGSNIRSIVVETSLASVTGTDNLRVWATTRVPDAG